MPPVQQYHVEIALNEELTNNQAAKVSIVSQNEQTAKQLLTKLLGSETKFIARDNGFDVFHPKVHAGKEPIGWGALAAPPQRFGVQSETQAKLADRIAA